MKLKTRTNQPVYYKLPVSSNIQSLSDDLLNSLRVGDVVQKKTGNQKHCYIVTYKEEKHGICLTYVDCGYMETISYDYTDGHWVYNSKDVKEVLGKNEDIQVKTLTQSEANYQKEFNFSVSNEGITTTNIYNRFEVINNVLYLVVNLQLTNTTENSISVYQAGTGWIYLSSAFGSKIIDLNGDSVHSATTNACLITGHEILETSDLTSYSSVTKNGYICFQNQTGADACSVIIRWNSPLSISAGESKWVTARLFLTLL